ncbi:hypothetical protein Agub_g5235 [Astrephomene gubernaculifera]|uniref:TATA box binding protein associated factor (TAF) histone-like fold domain-containing protein n=1 Tax=Astrephomene gubernaculifera TaxID=47775 RepID=A0AAD3HKV1_9CHLO|nr:hypothetical protein Agub_g5235 [Astrephomene gubernaculifera]
MNLIQPAAIKAIALSVDVTHLTDEAAKALAPDVEYRLREVIQDALKFARHSKRTKLTTQDVNNAMRLRNIEPMYGFLGNNDPAKFVRATGHPDVYFVRDATVPLEQITCSALPKAPNHTTVMPHWLFIDGVQPQTEENAAVDRPQPAPKRQRLASTGAAGGAAAAGASAAGAAAAGAGRGQAAEQGPGGRRRGDGTAAAAAGGVASPASPGGGGGGAGGEGGGLVGSGGGERVLLPVQHILSDEMQRLLDQIKQVLGTVCSAAPPPSTAAAGGQPCSLWGTLDDPATAAAAAAAAGGGASSSSLSLLLPPSELVLTPMQRAVLVTMQSDPGMQQLLPYLVKHVADEVAGGLRQLPRLHLVIRVMQALLLNPHVQLEPYLHQLMPPLLTSLMAKSLGPGPAADHWALRDAAAALLTRLCGRFGEPFYSLQVKISKQLLRTMLDGSKPLTSHYGAVAGLAAMGHSTVRLLLLPQLEPYLAKLQPALNARKEGVRQYEATKVYGALLRAAGAAMYDKLVGTAADGLLPVHLFRAAARSRRATVLALQGFTSPGPIVAAAAPTSPSSPAPSNANAAATHKPSNPTPTPANVATNDTPQHSKSPTAEASNSNPLSQAPNAASAASTNAARLEVLWQQTTRDNPALRNIFDAIVSNPSAPTSLSQLANLRGIAADPANALRETALAALHQLARLGIVQPPPLLQQQRQQPQKQQQPGAGAAAGGAGGAVLNGSGAPPSAKGDGVEMRMHASAEAAVGGEATGRQAAGGEAAGGGVVGGAALQGKQLQPGAEAAPLSSLSGRSPRAILAESWREDADLGEVVWALVAVFGPPFLAWLPQPQLLPAMLI